MTDLKNLTENRKRNLFQKVNSLLEKGLTVKEASDQVGIRWTSYYYLKKNFGGNRTTAKKRRTSSTRKTSTRRKQDIRITELPDFPTEKPLLMAVVGTPEKIREFARSF